MLTRFIPRILVVSLLLAFVVTGLNRFSADAAERTRWTDTVSVEDALVQACYGFNVTGSYTADRSIQIVEDYSGNLVYERRDVTFAGALGNATTGKSYAYDGQYTRTGSPVQDKFKFSDLSLRFEVGTPGEFTISIPQVDFNLSDNPNLIVKTLVLNALQLDMCQLFGGSAIGYDPITPSSHPSADMSAGILELPQVVPSFDERSGKNTSYVVHTENSVSNASVDVPSESAVLIPPRYYGEIEDNDGPSWTELDPCDTSPPGRPC